MVACNELFKPLSLAGSLTEDLLDLRGQAGPVAAPCRSATVGPSPRRDSDIPDDKQSVALGLVADGLRARTRRTQGRHVLPLPRSVVAEVRVGTGVPIARDTASRAAASDTPARTPSYLRQVVSSALRAVSAITRKESVPIWLPVMR